MMKKTTTQHNFEVEIQNMMKLIDSQQVKVSDARHLVMRCVNLLERYSEMQRSRDNWRKKYEVAKTSSNANNGGGE